MTKRYRALELLCENGYDDRRCHSVFEAVSVKLLDSGNELNRGRRLDKQACWEQERGCNRAMSCAHGGLTGIYWFIHVSRVISCRLESDALIVLCKYFIVLRHSSADLRNQSSALSQVSRGMTRANGLSHILPIDVLPSPS